MIKLNYAHLCDYAFLSQDGKVNVIGIFGAISGKQFPLTHPRFSFVANLKVGTRGMYDGVVAILDQGGKPAVPELNFKLETKEDNQSPNLILNFENVSFQKPGRYSIRIKVGKDEIANMPIELIQAN